MLTVKTISNILSLEEKTTTTPHQSIIDYLIEYHPDGFETPYRIYVDSRHLLIDDFDYKPKEGEIVYIFISPAVTAVMLGFAATSWLGIGAALAVNMAIATAVSFAVSKLFAPDMPGGMEDAGQQSLGKQSSVYNLNSNQNSRRLGQTIPVMYGRSRVYPSLIEQSYYLYRDNEMYLYQTMLVSAGIADITDVLIADSNELDLGVNDVVQEAFYDDSFNAGSIKTKIDSITNTDDFKMRVNTLPDVSGLELRGTPSNSNFIMSFDGVNITFYTFQDGIEPDLSSLVGGSKIEVTGTAHNDGKYIASGPAVNNSVPIASKVGGGWTSFTTEPTDIITVDTSSYSNATVNYSETDKRISIVLDSFPTLYLG